MWCGTLFVRVFWRLLFQEKLLGTELWTVAIRYEIQTERNYYYVCFSGQLYSYAGLSIYDCGTAKHLGDLRIILKWILQKWVVVSILYLLYWSFLFCYQKSVINSVHLVITYLLLVLKISYQFWFFLFSKLIFWYLHVASQNIAVW